MFKNLNMGYLSVSILIDAIVDLFESLWQLILFQNELILLTPRTGLDIQEVDSFGVNLTSLANSSCCCVATDWAQNEFERPQTDAAGTLVLKNLSLNVSFIFRRKGRGKRSSRFEHDWWLPGGSWTFASN